MTEDTADPKVWGQNWPQQYDSYLRTSLPTTTKYGGRGAGASDTGPAEQKLDRDPWLKRIFAGYAGWGEEQLEVEIREGSWFVVPSEPDDLFGQDPLGLWRRVLRRQPGELAWVSTQPADPTLN